MFAVFRADDVLKTCNTS